MDPQQQPPGHMRLTRVEELVKMVDQVEGCVWVCFGDRLAKAGRLGLRELRFGRTTVPPGPFVGAEANFEVPSGTGPTISPSSVRRFCCRPHDSKVWPTFARTYPKLPPGSVVRALSLHSAVSAAPSPPPPAPCQRARSERSPVGVPCGARRPPAMPRGATSTGDCLRRPPPPLTSQPSQ